MTIFTQDKVEPLAREFSAVLKDWLEPHEFERMVADTIARPMHLACYSHNYCDANMAMVEAWEKVFGQPTDIDSDEECKIWGEAWGMAIKRGFFHKP